MTGLHLVAQGRAEILRDDPALHRVAEAYRSKYEWLVEIRDGRFWAEGTPTAGPPPFDVLQLAPDVVFAFSGDGNARATRWRF
ncbi:MAG: hypothetical protein ACRDZO_00910 [Egibacteraceae bacterium]